MWYRVVTLDSHNVAQKGDYFFYENDTISVRYDFWYERGLVGFTISNKLNKPLYIDWKKSVLFVNNTSFPYWQDKEVSVYNSASTHQKNQMSRMLLTDQELLWELPVNQIV